MICELLIDIEVDIPNAGSVHYDQVDLSALFDTLRPCALQFYTHPTFLFQFLPTRLPV